MCFVIYNLKKEYIYKSNRNFFSPYFQINTCIQICFILVFLCIYRYTTVYLTSFILIHIWDFSPVFFKNRFIYLLFFKIFVYPVFYDTPINRYTFLQHLASSFARPISAITFVAFSLYTILSFLIFLSFFAIPYIWTGKN